MSAEAMKWAHMQLPAISATQGCLLQWLAWNHKQGKPIRLSQNFIATALGRDPANIRRSLLAMQAMGLLEFVAQPKVTTMIVLNMNIRLVLDEEGHIALESVSGQMESDGSYSSASSHEDQTEQSNHTSHEDQTVQSPGPDGLVTRTIVSSHGNNQLKEKKKRKGAEAKNSAEFSTSPPAPKEVKSSYPNYSDFDRIEKLGPDFNEELNEHNAEQFREYGFALRTELKSRFAAKFKAKHVDDRDVVEAVKDRWAKWDGQRWLQGGGPRA